MDANDVSPEDFGASLRSRPLYLNLRSVRAGGDFSVRNPEFLDAVGTLAATLHNKSKDDIVGAEIRSHRMFRATAATAMTLLLMLLIATTYASVRAVRQQNRAEHQADLARASEKTAQEQRGIAVRASGVATAAAAAEREQRKKADESRIIANRQRDVALEALTTLIFDAQDQLNAVPNSRQVRKQLLTTAAAKLENVDVNSPEVSLKVRTDGAIAFVKLADNMSQLGDSAEARRFYRRALGRFSVLLAERPTDWKLRNSVWLATSKLADAEATVFDFEPAKRHYREALTMIEQMSREEPNREDWAYPGFVDRLLVVSGTIA